MINADVMRSYVEEAKAKKAAEKREIVNEFINEALAKITIIAKEGGNRYVTNPSNAIFEDVKEAFRKAGYTVNLIRSTYKLEILW